MHIRTSNRQVTPDMLFCFHVLKPLSRVFSRIFGFSVKDGETRLRYLVGCCLDNTSISDYCLDHKAVSADTILKLGLLPLQEMTVKCNTLIGVSSKLSLKTGLYRGSDLGIDYHDMGFGGKRTPYSIKTVIGGKVRRGYRYGVVSVTGNKRFLVLGVQPYKQGDTNREIVHKLLSLSPIDFDPVLLDKYFSSVAVYTEIEGMGRNFITPYKINDTTDEMYKQSLLDGETAKMYHIRKEAGKSKWKSIYMHLMPDEENEYYAYASNLKNIRVQEHYPLRWNTENLFKTKNVTKPVTSTTHESFRLLLFTITLILASLWKLLVRSKQHITVKRFKKQLLAMIDEYTFNLSKANKTTAIT